MGIPVMILGESGSGKTTSFRNLNPKDVMMFQVTPKPLPFRAKDWKTSIAKTDNWQRIIAGIEKAPTLGKKIILIDDFQYMLAEEYLRRSAEVGFTKFTEISLHAREVIRAAQKAPDDTRIYITWHTQIDDQGTIKAKTIGKLLDEKFTIEGLFTIVFRAIKQDEDYLFSTQSNGQDVCKSPMGMFEHNLIPNDLAVIDSQICDYYGIEASNDNLEGAA